MRRKFTLSIELVVASPSRKYVNNANADCWSRILLLTVQIVVYENCDGLFVSNINTILAQPTLQELSLSKASDRYILRRFLEIFIVSFNLSNKKFL